MILSPKNTTTTSLFTHTHTHTHLESAYRADPQKLQQKEIIFEGKREGHTDGPLIFAVSKEEDVLSLTPQKK